MSQILDMDTLNTLRDVIGDDLKDIIDSFLQLLPGQISAIESAAKAGDSAALRLHAHTLKGSASNVGALELSTLALTLENMGRDGQPGAAMGQMSELRRLGDRASDALRLYIA